MKKVKPILDPLWITKGSYFDPEYFMYILLGASKKYQDEITKDDIDHFDEVLFHILNLNNLAMEGSLFTFKMEPVWNDPRLTQLRDQLKKIYDIPKETIEIFRNANYIFMNLFLDYLDIQLKLLDQIKLFYVNLRVHREKEIFLVTNYEGALKYKIWKISDSKRKNFGYSFEFVQEVIINELKPNILNDTIIEYNNSKLKNMIGDKNVIFAILKEGEDEKRATDSVKNLIMMNKGIAKGLPFEPNLLDEINALVWTEKVMPFTISSWSSEKSNRISPIF